MAKTLEQMQAKCRRERVYSGIYSSNKRLNTPWVTGKTDHLLDLLCSYYGVTKREMLEKLVADADDAICLELKSDNRELEKYQKYTSDSF
jgi:hypothetical protein